MSTEAKDQSLEATQLDNSFFDDDKEANVDKKRDFETNPDLYRVSLDMEGVKDRKYSARGRFLKDPTWKDTKNGGYVGKIAKNMYYLTDPENTDRKMYVECPSNWNIPSSQNILSAAFFYLWKHESATLRGIARNFKQLQYWWSLYQIIIDSQQPTLEGQIKILRYGTQVNDKIEAASKDQPNLGKLGLDVMNTVNGKDFYLILGEKNIDDKDRPGQTKKITTYEDSEFDSNITPMSINKVPVPIIKTVVEGKEKVRPTPEGAAMIQAYLKDIPSLRQMESVKWDENMEQKVIASMRIIISDDLITNEILEQARKGVRKQRVFLSQETKDKLAKEQEQQNTGAAAATNQPGANQPAASTPAAGTGGAAAATATQQEQKPADEAKFPGGGDETLPDVGSEDFSGGI